MSYISEVLQDAPEVLWLLDEESGTVAGDYLQGSHNGVDGTYEAGPTLGGPSIIGTNYGVATTSSSYVSLPRPADLPVFFSIETWYQYVSGAGIVFSDSRSASGVGWSMTLAGTNPVVTTDGFSHTVTSVTSASLKSGRHHVVLTGDGSSVRLYVDKVQQDIWAAPCSGSSLGTRFILGRDGLGATYSPAKYAAFAVYPYRMVLLDIARHFDAADSHDIRVAPVTVTALPTSVTTPGSATVSVTALQTAISETVLTRANLVLTSSTTDATETPPAATTLTVEALHIVAPAVPVPTLVDGRPQ